MSGAVYIHVNPQYLAFVEHTVGAVFNVQIRLEYSARGLAHLLHFRYLEEEKKWHTLH